MKIVNTTPLPVLTMPTMGPDDTPILTIVVKGTFFIKTGQPAILSKEQLPILVADELSDPEKASSPRFEDDMAPHKPRADVVVVGKAKVPGDRQVTSIDVGFQVGSLGKLIRVFGDRFWFKKGLFGSLAPSAIVPFSEMELAYERAFGGMDRQFGIFCPQNPVGRGLYGEKTKPEEVEKKPLPNLEDPHNLINAWKDRPTPMGFGFLGKAWEPRLALMGSYDENWKNERSPERPKDFSFEFFNAAPRDQQVEGYLQGNESVELFHLTSEGRGSFQLSGLRPTVKYSGNWADAGESQVAMHLDTLCLMPEQECLYQVWRGSIPIRDLSAEEIRRLDIAI